MRHKAGEGVQSEWDRRPAGRWDRQDAGRTDGISLCVRLSGVLLRRVDKQVVCQRRILHTRSPQAMIRQNIVADT